MISAVFHQSASGKVLKSEDDEEDPEAPAAVNKKTVLSQHIISSDFQSIRRNIGSLHDVLEIM